jgi:hypothetical protein
MIDHLKITIKDFAGTFDNCVNYRPRYHRKFGLMEFWDLPGIGSGTTHYMKVRRLQMSGNTIYVSGSIRKWAYNKNTFADLTSTMLEHAFSSLAEKLNIPLDELYAARVTQCEIGLNIRPRIPSYKVLPLFVKYSTLKINREYQESGTIYFNGTAKKLKIYDKGREIIRHAPHSKERWRRFFNGMGAKGYNFLRVEYTLPNQKSFKQNKLECITCTGDLVKSFPALFEFWCKETNRIILFNNIEIDESVMIPAEHEIAEALNKYGYEHTIDTRQKKVTTENINSVYTQRSQLKSDILNVIKKYDTKEYRTYSFRRDATRYILIWSKGEPSIDLPKGLKLLWKS